MSPTCPPAFGIRALVASVLITAAVAPSSIASALSEDDLSDTAGVIRLASQALREKNFPKAESLYERAIASIDLESGPMSWLKAELDLCHTYNLQGRVDEAISHAERVVDTCELKLGVSDPLTNEAIAYLGWLLRRNGRPSAAEPVYRRNLALLEAKYGPEHFLVANAATRLAELLHEMDRREESEELNRRAFKIMMATAGDDRPDACLVMTNLAECLIHCGKKQEAISVMDRAFEIARNTSDSSLPSAGTILRKQAEFYRNIKKLDRAEELSRRALRRLAERNDTDRSKFFHYSRVRALYAGILGQRGLDPMEVEERLRKAELTGSSH